jgi:cell division protein FtsB
VKKLLLLSPLFLLFSFAHAQTAKPKVKVMQFKNEKLKYAPKDYHISAVVDDRNDTSDIGTVKVGIGDKPATLKLQGGAAYALSEFISTNLKQDRKTHPIELHITTLDVSEKRSGGMDKADIDIAYTFYINGDKAIELSSNAYVKSGLDATEYIEEMVRRQTESALKQFGEWWTDNKKEYLAGPGVTVKVSVEKNPRDKDYIPYSSKRSLDYSDFQGIPDGLSRGAAATASAVSMNAGSLARGRQVELDIKIGALFDRKHSWFKKDAIHPRVLAHEQLHFDITAYMACELIHTIRNFKFTPENYEDELQDIKKRNEQETEAMQNQYDEESNHGLVEKKQKEWEARIAELMSRQDCFE